MRTILSFIQLAQEFKEGGCTIAYNLDGGGPSTMYFNGKIINNPTDGRSYGERRVSDILYPKSEFATAVIYRIYSK